MKVGLLLLAITFCAAPCQAQRRTPGVGDVAPVVTVSDLDGSPVRVGVAPGKRGALIEFWATWCEVCKALMPTVAAAHAKYGDRVDFIGVNVTVNESESRVRRYLDQHKPPFRTVYDTAGASQRAFGAPATSYVVIVDAKGRIRYTGSGARQDLVGELAKVVGQ
jgi:cytochrome c biogenesis protein CcmG/thiol:disulfide interchange protein DsbE